MADIPKRSPARRGKEKSLPLSETKRLPAQAVRKTVRKPPPPPLKPADNVASAAPQTMDLVSSRRSCSTGKPPEEQPSKDGADATVVSGWAFSSSSASSTSSRLQSRSSINISGDGMEALGSLCHNTAGGADSQEGEPLSAFTLRTPALSVTPRSAKSVVAGDGTVRKRCKEVVVPPCEAARKLGGGDTCGIRRVTRAPAAAEGNGRSLAMGVSAGSALRDVTRAPPQRSGGTPASTRTRAGGAPLVAVGRCTAPSGQFPEAALATDSNTETLVAACRPPESKRSASGAEEAVHGAAPTNSEAGEPPCAGEEATITHTQSDARACVTPPPLVKSPASPAKGKPGAASEEDEPVNAIVELWLFLTEIFTFLVRVVWFLGRTGKAALGFGGRSGVHPPHRRESPIVSREAEADVNSAVASGNIEGNSLLNPSGSTFDTRVQRGILQPLLARLDTSRDFLAILSGNDEEDPTLSPGVSAVEEARRLQANALIRENCRAAPPETLEMPLRIHMATWNVNTQPNPSTTNPNFQEWLLGKSIASRLREEAENGIPSAALLCDFPDIVAVSLQEVEGGSVVLLKEFTETSVTWGEAIVDCLTEASGKCIRYRSICSVQLVGLVLIVCSRVDHMPFIRNIKSCITRTGAMRGMLGNKGSVGIRATIYGKRFLFVAAHFHAHKHNERTRNSNYYSALQDLNFVMPYGADDECEVVQTFKLAEQGNAFAKLGIRGASAWDRLFRRRPRVQSSEMERRVLDVHDYVFFMGDLNSRLHAVSSGKIKALIARGEYDNLLCHDELRQGMVSGEIFDGFQEMAIDFPPTYKFDPETDTYDTSSKQRDPAWCDRILFRQLERKDERECLPCPTPADCVQRNIPMASRDGIVELPVGLAQPGALQVARATTATPLSPLVERGNSLSRAAELMARANGAGVTTAPRVGLPPTSSCSTLSPYEEVKLRHSNTGSSHRFAGGTSRLRREESVPLFSACRHPSSATRCDTGPFPMVQNAIEALAYSSIKDMRTSDHRAVSGQFEVCVISIPSALLTSILAEVDDALEGRRRS